MRISFSLIVMYLIGFLFIILSCEEQNPQIIDNIFFDDSIKLGDSTFYQITSPNGGEVWSEQSTQTITWNKGGDISSYVELYYSINGVWSNISNWTSNDGEYTWTIPDLAFNSDSCLIRIVDESNSSISDMSDTYFTLTADSTFYQITSPNGGESWEELSEQTIGWVSSGEVASSYEYLQLYYSLDGGVAWTQMGSTYEYNDGVFSWALPQVYITNSTCRIKIRQYYSPYIEDISDEDFTIYASGSQSDLINVISANGGEEWHEQTTEQITWTTNGDIGGNQVYIGYSTDGGNSWSDVVDDGGSNSYEETDNPPYTSRWDETANNGSYNWALPNFSDTLQHCIIGIWSAANTALYDMSDDYFTISCDSNYYRILHPNGGETFQMGTDRYILWESAGDVGTINLYYSEYNGDSWYSIDNYLDNDGSHIWPVPMLQGDNPNCLIKIEDRDNPDWFDISDANFTIAADTVIFDFDMSFENSENIASWTFGDAWTVDNLDSFDGNKSAVCAGGDGSLSKIMTVNSGVMSFFYRTKFYSYSCSYDYFVFKIDGEEIFEVCGPTTEIDWTLFEYYLDAGSYLFEWEWNAWSSSNSYYSRIDAISFP